MLIYLRWDPVAFTGQQFQSYVQDKWKVYENYMFKKPQPHLPGIKGSIWFPHRSNVESYCRSINAVPVTLFNLTRTLMTSRSYYKTDVSVLQWRQHLFWHHSHWFLCVSDYFHNVSQCPEPLLTPAWYHCASPAPMTGPSTPALCWCLMLSRPAVCWLWSSEALPHTPGVGGQVAACAVARSSGLVSPHMGHTAAGPFWLGSTPAGDIHSDQLNLQGSF